MITKQRWQFDPTDRDYKLMTIDLHPSLVLGDITGKYQQRCYKAHNLAPFKVVREKNGQFAFDFQ